MKTLTVILLYILFIGVALADDEKFKLDDMSTLNHLDGTRFVEAEVYAVAETNDFWTDNIRIQISYDLKCHKELETFQHAKASPNKERESRLRPFKFDYEISNKTDDAVHVNGYQVYDAWEWLTQNPDDNVLCYLKYQSNAGFSTTPITIGIGNGYPLSATFTANKESMISGTKSSLVKLEPPAFGDGGGGGECIAHCTPILIDLAGDGIHLGRWGVGVYFDLLNTGEPLFLQWVAPNGNEAFLALDHNNNGIIDNGNELFGSGTTMISESQVEQNAPNGFVALAQYDQPQLGGNNDGYITVEDEVWPLLRVWLDKNADGISTPNEMDSLASTGITELETIPRVNQMREDNYGNLLPYWAWARQVDGHVRRKFSMVDVYFKVLQP